MQIDALMHELYGLTDKEIAAVGGAAVDRPPVSDSRRMNDVFIHVYLTH